MTNSQTPAELKNCIFENPSLLFGPLVQYLASDKRWVLSLASHIPIAAYYASLDTVY